MTAFSSAQRRGSVALAGREVRRVLVLWTQTILPPALTAVLLLAIFGGALGGRLRVVEGLRYADFILPGLLVMTTASQSFANTSTSLFQAKNEGYVEDVLTSPLSAWQIVLAYLAGGVVRAGLAALAVVAAATPFTRGIRHPALVAAVLALTALVFATLGIVTGMWAETFDQHAFVASIVITPLALLGGVFYSARTLAEPWRTLTRLDPLYYLVDGTRSGFVGLHETPVAVSLSAAALAAATSFVAATTLLARGWRLKP